MTEERLEKTMRSGVTAEGDPVVFLDAEGKNAMPADHAEILGAAFTATAKRAIVMADVRKWLLDSGCTLEVANKAVLDLEKKDLNDKLMQALMPMTGMFGR